MPRRYRVAVIGRTGRGNYGHGLDAVWTAIPNAEVVAVADEDDKGRAAAASRLKAKAAYADYRQMLDKEKPEIVSVAPRWIDCHRDMAVACAEAKAHVFMDKPMARSLAEADEIVAACERNQVKLALALQTSYSPRVQRICELIRNGRLGDLIELRGRGKEDHRGGCEDWIVHGCHIFGLMRQLAGEARWCVGQVVQNGKPVGMAQVHEGNEGLGLQAGDHLAAVYGFDGGVRATHGSHSPRPEVSARFGLTILGTKGVIQLTTGSLPPTYFLDDPSWFPGHSRRPWQEITSAGLGQPEPLKDGGLHQANVWIVQDLLEAIEKDRQPLVSVYDAQATLEMTMGLYEAHRVGGPVELPLKNRQHPLALLK